MLKIYTPKMDTYCQVMRHNPMNTKHVRITQWACAYLLSHGYQLKNNVPEEVQITPWSYVVRFITSDGYIYLKHTPELIALEPLIIQMLQKQLHASVPQIIARNAELHCFLMKDAGRPLREVLKKQFDEPLFCKAVDQFTSLQLATANYIDALLGIGVPDWRLDKLPDLYKEFLEQKELLIADGLSEQEIKTLITLIPKVSHLCEQLDKYAIKQTIVQPDFNDNNTLIDEQLQFTTIDLGEIVISHPFFSLLNGLLQIKKHYGLTEEDEAYLRIKQVCFKKFTHPDALEQVLAIAEILWIVYWALSHYRLMLACGIEQIMAVQRGRICDSLKSLLIHCKA